ncbi:MAG: zinc-binding dehydrogenase [Kiritimatiellia bacterium]|jgi:threonine dehydrogenase-like Zn-dependent dehydrogenase
MKAAVVEAKNQLVVRELPDPVIGDYDARCDLLYGALCAGTDVHLIRQDRPYCEWVTLPFVLGHESIGRVVEVGAKVRNLRPGDLVTRVGTPPSGGVNIGWGGFATMGVAKDWRAMQEDGVDGWKDSTVQQVLPADIDPFVGTMFITWRETLSYTTRMGLRPGAKALVIGSGGNGLSFVAHCRNLGASRVTMVGAAGRAPQGRLAGATDCLDYRDPDCWKKAMEIVPDGYDFVIDAVGKAAMTLQGLDCLRPGGTIGTYGMDEFYDLRLTPSKTFTCYAGGYDEAETHDAALLHYRAGRLNPAAWIDRDHLFDLDDIHAAFENLKTREVAKPVVRLA